MAPEIDMLEGFYIDYIKVSSHSEYVNYSLPQEFAFANMPE